MNVGIGNVKSKIESGELLTTTTAPTESGGVITISTSDISGTPKENNYLAYIDSDNITALYKITNISSGTATLSLIGNVGGGGGESQLYQHNVYWYVGYNKARITFQIFNSSATPLTLSTIVSFLVAKGFTSRENSYMVSGVAESQNYSAVSIYASDSTHINVVYWNGSSMTFALTDSVNYNDQVIKLI